METWTAGDSDPAQRLRVAVVGGGVTGATCALELLRRAGGRVAVTVFDQGFGVGGRCAHRRVLPSGDVTKPSSEEAPFRFDHGCQFFRADSERFRSELLAEWLDRGWAAAWSCRFGMLPDASACASASSAADFFGAPGRLPVYTGVGGMCAVPVGILEEALALGCTVRSGVRVASMNRLSTAGWLLSGTSGKAALHDTKEEEAARASPDSLGEFDAVVVTDVSASMGSWHRASAGVPEAMASRVRGRTRVALFVALFAFETPVQVPLDAISCDDDTLWFAARTSSKPGLEAGGLDCWTLVSTPRYAVAEVARVPMQDPKTGAFIPQDMSYLREAPCADLRAAFERMLGASEHAASSLPLPKAVYVGGQRWGSAFPAPAGVGGRDAAGRGPQTVEVLGVAYDSAASLDLVPEAAEGTPADGARDFFADDEERIYYAGDYISTGRPGVESAALSGLGAARHVAAALQARA